MSAVVPSSRTPHRRNSLASRVLLIGVFLLLAACAWRPNFAILNARVIPDAPLNVSDSAELRIALESLTDDGERGELIAESRYPRVDDGIMLVALQFDARALDTDGDYVVIAQVRDAGRVIYTNREQVPVKAAGIATTRFDIPLAPR